MQNCIQFELEDVDVVVSMGAIKSFKGLVHPKKMVILNNPHTVFTGTVFFL